MRLLPELWHFIFTMLDLTSIVALSTTCNNMRTLVTSSKHGAVIQKWRKRYESGQWGKMFEPSYHSAKAKYVSKNAKYVSDVCFETTMFLILTGHLDLTQRALCNNIGGIILRHYHAPFVIAGDHAHLMQHIVTHLDKRGSNSLLSRISRWVRDCCKVNAIHCLRYLVGIDDILDMAIGGCANNTILRDLPVLYTYATATKSAACVTYVSGLMRKYYSASELDNAHRYNESNISVIRVAIFDDDSYNKDNIMLLALKQLTLDMVDFDQYCMIK